MVRLPPRSTRTATLFPFTTPVRSTRIDEPRLAVRTVFNPFYTVADNIGSCYVARHEMDDPFVLLNGDTVIEPGIVETLLAERLAPITVTIDRKTRYDDDDMKVSLDGSRLTAIGKKLALETVDAESIGLLRFDQRGAELFRGGLEAVLREPGGRKSTRLNSSH